MLTSSFRASWSWRTLGGTAVVLIYLVALAVLVAAFYAVAYAVT
jgi:hypothetical protein